MGKYDKEQEKENKLLPRDDRCAYHAGTQRCRNAGSISDGVRGGGPWFCAYHFRNRDPYSEDSHRVVRESQNNPDAEKRAANRPYFAK